jgi:hypothetical protein
MKWLLVLLLSGCASVSDFVPSLQYCDTLQYDRQGKDFVVMARCRVP